ncbi:MAG: asparagine synthase (glutamine-hydrolyzing) [Oscillospiraceae bacterium]|nr:asparagine synthase (glutamine-hydrolyzing) [Oscillospiraceae bacterium]
MCAIAGMIGQIPQDGVLEKMLKTMHRRGPDGSGIFRQGPVSLLHTRLAIIDPKGGAQPMNLQWGQEEYVLVYNGELYNTQELRQELTALGHGFRGHSDTEILLHAYAQFGEDCLEKLNGIYAFAVWEKEANRLFLARDRIGVKPLFYSIRNQQLVFASEIKTLFAAGEKPRLDRQGAAQILLLGPGRLPGSGVFRDIMELEPGCCAYYEGGQFRQRRYWKLTDREHTQSFSETAEQVRFLVTDAIKRQMVSDVPIGTFLSGGLDSSIITAVCAKAMEEKGLQLPTFSVDYQDNQKYFTANSFQPDTDASYIQLMVKAFNCQQHQSVLTPEVLAENLTHATVARDLPGMADVDFSLLAFCAQIRPRVKVALSGECADEIFGGYPWYRDSAIRSQDGFPWAQNTAQRKSLLTADAAVDAEAFVRDAYEQICIQSDILPGQSTLEKRMKEMVNLNFRCFMQTLLDRKDRMSMYHGLEVRVPFCDHRIAQYLYAVPWAYKDYRNQEKGLLRYAVGDLLPKEITNRKKSPYPKTFDPKYELIMERLLQKRLQENVPIWHMVRKDALQSVLDEVSPWPWYGQLMRRPQMMAYFLQLDFWLKYYAVEFVF